MARRMAVVQTARFAVALLCALGVLGSKGAAVAAAAEACGPEGTIFMHPPGAPHAHGVQALVLVRDRTSSGTCADGDIIGGGTSIMGIGGSTSTEWLEIGWRVKLNLGAHTYVLFVEHGQNGQDDYNYEFASGCAAQNTNTYFKVVFLAGTTWSTQYSCNGGGWTDKHHHVTGNTWGDAKGETFRFGGSSMQETHDNLQYKTTADVWQPDWGGLPTCQQALNYGAGWGISRISASKYYTVPSSTSSYCG